MIIIIVTKLLLGKESVWCTVRYKNFRLEALDPTNLKEGEPILVEAEIKVIFREQLEVPGLKMTLL